MGEPKTHEETLPAFGERKNHAELRQAGNLSVGARLAVPKPALNFSKQSSMNLQPTRKRETLPRAARGRHDFGVQGTPYTLSKEPFAAAVVRAVRTYTKPFLG